MDYKDRIRKLLALATSPEEGEAEAALLKARELMAKYKLKEMDVREVKDHSVKRELTDITFSMRRNPWTNDLAVVIGENYCCKAYNNHWKGEKTYTVGFVGFEDDLAICLTIFRYALDCVLSRNQRMKKKLAGYPASYINSLCNGYAYGFVAGLRKAFDQQKAEHSKEWGLVLVTPKEVLEEISGFKHRTHRPKAVKQIDADEYRIGFSDGKQFDPAKRIGPIDRRESA